MWVVDGSERGAAGVDLEVDKQAGGGGPPDLLIAASPPRRSSSYVSMSPPTPPPDPAVNLRLGLVSAAPERAALTSLLFNDQDVPKLLKNSPVRVSSLGIPVGLGLRLAEILGPPLFPTDATVA
ncbi:hypothetical protein E2562_016149 [Oryza meyeriana var. granulata]|uniref:Uncharacterized protein n=1 Tax=Oryza meyeriana var. granulata TaxID=110450 RepID=A0A6G1F8M4_9ORYZ|nr:hypothetical protein E2562_016149 [Oryza meyeriana var. granulata]